MAVSLRNQNVCKQCWRPSLNIQGDNFACPTCGAKYTKDFKPVAFPSIELYNQNVLFLMSGILGHSDTKLSLSQIIEIIGLNNDSLAEQWILAVHHLNCHYRHYRNIYGKPKDTWLYTQNPLTQSPPLKRSFPGAFSDYRFSYWRTDDSPLMKLSDNGFDILNSVEVRHTLPYPINRLNYSQLKQKCFTKPRNYRNITEERWSSGIEELLLGNFIEKASISDNLEWATFKQLRAKLQEHKIKGAKSKEDAINLALEKLPQNALQEIIEPIQAYIPLQPIISEFTLRVYGLPNLFDSVRRHNSFSRENITPEEFTKINREGDGTPNLYDISISLLERAQKSSNYEIYLANGLIPAEAFLAEIYARMEKYEYALSMANQAYKLDIENNSVSQLVNINHFGSLIRLKLSLELIISKYKNIRESSCNPSETESIFKMWISLYDRGSNDGFTPFLLENYEEIFENFGDCSRESENKYRELLGIPRIGEGWVSEAELLNIVRSIFPNEKVLHQGSPEWLGLQRLDIYVPRLKLAIEYQGRQHFEPVSFFGGDEGFKRTQERDKRKADLCFNNGIQLLYFQYDETISKDMVEQKIKSALKKGNGKNNAG